MTKHKMEGLYYAQPIKVARPFEINAGINSNNSSKLT
jgi:hypothetical protein